MDGEGNGSDGGTGDGAEGSSGGAASGSTEGIDESALGDAGKRALDAERKARRDAERDARDWRARAEANEAAAQKVKDAEDAGKTEIQRATEAATAASKRADEAELRALRLEVAHEKGLSPAQAKRLVGKDRAELEADADELLEAFKQGGSATGQTGSGRPKERLRGGAAPDGEAEPTGKDLLDKMPRTGAARL